MAVRLSIPPAATAQTKGALPWAINIKIQPSVSELLTLNERKQKPTVNALYLQLLEMQKAFTATGNTSNTLPSSEDIRELQIEYTNMLTAIIDLLDGAKYLWEENCHEQQS